MLIYSFVQLCFALLPTVFEIFGKFRLVKYMAQKVTKRLDFVVWY